MGWKRVEIRMNDDCCGVDSLSGLNGSFGSSFPNPMYSAGISPTTSSMTSCESPGILSRPKSSHTHSSTEKSSSSKAANSSPVPKESSRSQKEHRNKLKDSSDVDSNATFASPGRNSARSFAGSSKSDAKESSTPVKNSSNNATPMGLFVGEFPAVCRSCSLFGVAIFLSFWSHGGAVIGIRRHAVSWFVDVFLSYDKSRLYVIPESSSKSFHPVNI